MVFKYSAKDMVIILFFSFALVTILNVLVHYAFPAFPIVKTGFAFILLLVAIVLVMLFTVASDGKLERDEILGMIVVLAIMFVLYWAVKHFIPDLFTIVPTGIKEAFAIVP